MSKKRFVSAVRDIGALASPSSPSVCFVLSDGTCAVSSRYYGGGVREDYKNRQANMF